MSAQSIPTRAPAAYHTLWLLVIAFLLSGLPVQAVVFSPEEQKLASLLTSASGQRRDRSQMRPDDRLTQVARARAMDMAKRHYFDHVNPDGVAANALVRATGYQLPSFWPTSPKTNSIESIGAGYATAEEAWKGWMSSSPHKAHLLATDSFYRDQTSYGIGHYYDSGSQYKHYWVIITAPPSPVAALSIVTPTAGARLTTGSVAVAGTVSGDAVFSSLQYRLETPAGAGAWTSLTLPAGTAVGRWTANVAGLKPGVNTLRVRTTNTSGAVAKETTRSVKLVVLEPLVVAVDGAGTVTPGFVGTTQREVGAPFTIAGIPQKGAIFASWSSLPEGLDAFRGTQSMTMVAGLSLTAHFIPDPYPALSGGYGGVFTDTSPSQTNTGALFAKINSGGAFTGALFFSGHRYTLQGRFNSQGDVTLSLPRVGLTPLTLALHIDTTGVDQQITGTLSDGTVSIALAAARSPATAEVAHYNLRIAPSADATTPQGFGYAMVYIAQNGLVRISGMLADGTPIAAASYVTAGGIPIYIPLVGGTGSLAGTLVLNGDTAQGTLDWHKPARPGTRFPAAFDTQNVVSGSLYVPPVVPTVVPKTVPAPAPANPVAETLQIDSPELPDVLTLPFNLSAMLRVTYPTTPVAGWRLAINPRTGRFTGSYVHPGGGVRLFSGLFDAATSAGYGYSLAPAQSAAVSFAP